MTVASGPGRQRGSATALDFMLTFPIFAFLMLFFMQMALVLHAYTVVQHAAYKAARAARVHVLDVDHAFLALNLNVVQQLITNAPMLVSISPASSDYATNNTGTNWNEESFRQYVTNITEGYGERTEPLIRKARYAYDPNNTIIELSLLPDFDISLNTASDVEVIYNLLREKWDKLRAGNLSQDGFVDWPVYVTVSYRYQLQIPIGNFWFENDPDRRYARWMTAKVRLL